MYSLTRIDICYILYHLWWNDEARNFAETVRVDWNEICDDGWGWIGVCLRSGQLLTIRKLWLG